MVGTGHLSHFHFVSSDGHPNRSTCIIQQNTLPLSENISVLQSNKLSIRESLSIESNSTTSVSPVSRAQNRVQSHKSTSSEEKNPISTDSSFNELSQILPRLQYLAPFHTLYDAHTLIQVSKPAPTAQTANDTVIMQRPMAGKSSSSQVG
jgi:hypothetical protein